VPGKSSRDTTQYLFLTREYRIVDDKGNDVAEGQGGEILVKGPYLMLGYIDNPRASEEAFVNDGWLCTGDYGHKSQGKIFFGGRKKDIIKVNAYQVSPAEVEARLKQHHSIKDAAVIGIEGASCKGDLVRAYIVLRDGTKFEEAEIRRYLREHLHSYEIPAEFKSIESIPKSATGKIERRQLKEKASEELQQVLTADTVPAAEPLPTNRTSSSDETFSTAGASSTYKASSINESVASADLQETIISTKEHITPEESTSAVKEAGSNPWRHAIAQKAAKTTSLAARTLGRFFSWLRRLFI
jgi:long-subunit acyl-CoA synthetase (AMP-forming)